MYLLLPSLLLFHIVVLVILYTATISNAWFHFHDGNVSGLWFHCAYSERDSQWVCSSTKVSTGEEWLGAVQGSMVLVCLFCSASFLIFACQLYSLRRGSLFYLTAIFQIFAGLCAASASLMYTLHAEDIHHPAEGVFGYSYALSWVGCPLTLASGIMYLHLRKLQ
ncbi:peripheral myelin protein 22-like [Hemitrygon akajei]|uniref:peripheral myelin protein 22-like n=1 Tax=Hemitrygon akajei TaxID=2704970 RepID=UPI003BF9B822